jgi:hypothetical protein
MKISNKNIATALILMGMLVPLSAYADTPTTYTPLAPLPCIESPAFTYVDSGGNTVNVPKITCKGGNGAIQPTVDVQQYVQYTFNLFIALAAVAAVFMITWGGFEYMTSVAPGSKSDGLGKVKNAIYGLLLVLCSFLILKAINPQFVQVPQGLVAPLNICKTNPSLCTNTIASWQQQLDNQAVQFDTQSQQATAANNQANAAVATAQQQLTASENVASRACLLANETGNTDDLTACQNATNAQNIAQNQVNLALSNAALTKSQQNIAATLNTVSSGVEQTINGVTTYGSNLATIAAAQTELSQTYAAGTQGIQTNGNNPAQIQALNNAYTSAAGQLNVQQFMQDTQLSPSDPNYLTVPQAISEIQTIQNTYPSKILPDNDPQAKQELNNLNTTISANLTQLQNRQAIQQAAQPGSNTYTTGSFH